MFVTLDINGRSEVHCLERYLEQLHKRIEKLEELLEAQINKNKAIINSWKDER